MVEDIGDRELRRLYCVSEGGIGPLGTCRRRAAVRTLSQAHYGNVERRMSLLELARCWHNAVKRKRHRRNVIEVREWKVEDSR